MLGPIYSLVEVFFVCEDFKKRITATLWQCVSERDTHKGKESKTLQLPSSSTSSVNTHQP